MAINDFIQNILDSLHLTDSLGSQVAMVFLRSTAIIIPPIQGWLFDVVSIGLFGPVKAFIITEIGLIIGASTAFGIARVFREPLLKRFVSIQKIHQWEQALSHKEKFWSLVLLRLPSNLFFDYISYAAGLTNCTYKMFITTSVIGSLPSILLFYLISHYAYQWGGWASGLMAALGLYVFGFIFYKVYKRYPKIPNP